MKSFLKRAWRDNSGQDLAEYCLLLAGVVLVLIASIGGLASSLDKAFRSAAAGISNPAGAGGGGGQTAQ